MMKFIQYIILFILIANGSYPFLIESGLIETQEVVLDCENEQDVEEQDEDDLAAPDKHVYKEPKPSELQEYEDLIPHVSASRKVVYGRTLSYLGTRVSAVGYIPQALLRHVYFSKSGILHSNK